MSPISIRNAHLHNLKNIDIDIPKDKLVVVTGVSGSGKSSLIFDIVFALGRKGYLQAIGVLGDLGGDSGVESISGLRPTVAIKQGIVRHSNPRSVIGTRTHLLKLLGTLYADYANRQASIDAAISYGHFSFNSPLGMCLHCQGRGYQFALNFEVLLPHKRTTLRELYENAQVQTRFNKSASRLAEKYDFDLDAPFLKLPETVRNLVLYGQNPSGAQRVGVETHLQHLLQRGRAVNNAISAQVCPDCAGYRVSEEARAITINGRHIGELGVMTINQLDKFMTTLDERQHSHRRKSQSPINTDLCKKIRQIIAQLFAVKLDYLSLYRPIPTLSGGETQRLFLMSYLNTEMESLLYIFDEPTAGLHELEKHELLKNLLTLRQRGNALIIVEHDPQSIKVAEHVIDIGPLAGPHGGDVVYQGSYKGLLRCKDSITGQYLSGKRQLPKKSTHKKVTRSSQYITLSGVQTNNLKSVSVKFPIGAITGIAGMSGSGKSSLIADTLVPVLQMHLKSGEPPEAAVDIDVDNASASESTLNLARPVPLYRDISGFEAINRCVEVSQAPIGRRANSNPVTYLGIWDRIRRRFAAQALAKERGYAAGHFSFNAAGACEHCQGSGQHRMWLGSTFVTYECDTCDGEGYQRDILDVKFQEHSITDVLRLTAEDASALFSDDDPIHRMLNILVRTGMGYLTLGQPTSTLSGGEAQRIKLAKELGRRQSQHNTLFILDEPTTGLSLHDTARLLSMLDELVNQGNSVIVIEHDPSVLSYCDWLIEVGPEGGHQGGKIIAKGTPTSLHRNKRSLIGPFLSPLNDE